MKRTRFSVEQIVGMLKQAEVGVPVAGICRQAGISEQTFYRWKKQYVRLEVDQVRQLKQLQEENARLKKLGRLQLRLKKNRSMPKSRTPRKISSGGRHGGKR